LFQPSDVFAVSHIVWLPPCSALWFCIYFLVIMSLMMSTGAVSCMGRLVSRM